MAIVFLAKSFIDWVVNRPRAMWEYVREFQAREIERNQERDAQVQELREEVRLLRSQQTQVGIFRWSAHLLAWARFIAWVLFGLGLLS